MGAITNEEGVFELEEVKPGKYNVEVDYMGYEKIRKSVFVGSQSDFLDIGNFKLEKNSEDLDEVLITTKRDELNNRMDKKTFSVDKNITQTGGSVLQSMRNLPGVNVQDGKVQIRGNDQVIILVDGKQTAITGIGG